ncbi:MAG: hypothetical protein HY770_00765, partial [Chitinivibrionia bacterium]|nr:hypothetical protein [Chitinivibrionia bacterium]
MSILFACCILAACAGCQVDQSQNAQPPDVPVECGTNLGLTPESGLKTDWDEVLRGWSWSVDGAQLTLTRKGLCGDECNFTEEIILAGITDSCPQFVSARFAKTDVGGAKGSVVETIQADKGVLKIEKWEYPNGVISGALETEV